MSFTWEQEVSMCLIQILLDPDLVHYFMKILKPLQRDFVFQEAKEFHCSLRLTMEDRNKKMTENKNNRDFYLMNPGVPITFPLPFNCKQWRDMKINFTIIRFLVEGFMVEETTQPPQTGPWLEGHDHPFSSADQPISGKLTTINNLTKDLEPRHPRSGPNFVYNTLKEFDEAYKEFRDCMSKTEYGVMESDYPTLLSMRDQRGNPICVIMG